MWLFGSRVQQQSRNFPQEAQPSSASDAEDSGNNAPSEHVDTYRFNSIILERAAAFAQGLGKSAEIRHGDQDLQLTQTVVNAAEDLLESTNTAGSVSRTNVTPPLLTWENFFVVTGNISFIAIVYCTAKGTISAVHRCILAGLDKPWAVRETSRLSIVDCVHQPMKILQKLKEKLPGTHSDVFLDAKLQAELKNSIRSAKHIKERGGPYQNILMYGPSGNNKLLFAKNLAQQSGMEYAVIDGRDFIRSDRDGVTDVDRVFEWIETSKKDVLLFVNQADVILKKRPKRSGAFLQRDIRDAFFFKSDNLNRKFKVVLACNALDQLDKDSQKLAFNKIEFQLPGVEERERLLRSYFDKFLQQPATEGKGGLKIARFDYGPLCHKIAMSTEGFTEEELSKLQELWEAALSTSADGVLTEQLVNDKCLEAIEQHKREAKLKSKEERKNPNQAMLRQFKRPKTSEIRPLSYQPQN